jgi:hypothetical protein
VTKTKQGDIRNEWDVVTSTFDGGVIWRRYGDRKIVTTHGSESPDEALARREKKEKQGKERELDQARRCRT